MHGSSDGKLSQERMTFEYSLKYNQISIARRLHLHAFFHIRISQKVRQDSESCRTVITVTVFHALENGDRQNNLNIKSYGR